MKKNITLAFIAGLIGVIFLISSVSVGSAMPNYQTILEPTPTPGLDGRIFYQVQEGDTLWDIAARFGFDQDKLAEIRTLNNMDDADVVIAGQFLILGVASQQGDDSGENVDPGEILLTPEATLPPGNGTICVLLYEDENGDSFRQEMEVSIVEGAVSVTEKSGLFSESTTTVSGYDPVCFEDIPEGEYNISIALPENYNPTTFMTASLTLHPGDTSYINFGGQFSGNETVENPEEEGSSSNLLLGIGGIVLVVGGIGLGAYTLLRGRRVDIPEM